LNDPAPGLSWSIGRSFEARSDPRGGVNSLISVCVVDEAEHHHGVIACGLEAFRNERSAAIRSLAGHSSELRQALIEQALPMVDRRFGARSVSFGIFSVFCICLWGRF
jgi:hypothetical protein